MPAGKIGLAIWLLKCFYEAFVQGSALMILLKFSGKIRHIAKPKTVVLPLGPVNLPRWNPRQLSGVIPPVYPNPPNNYLDAMDDNLVWLKDQIKRFF